MKSFNSKSAIMAAVALAAAAGLTACSDDNDSPAVPGKDAISFSVTVPKASRAVTTTNSINNFSVWAFVDGAPYMSNVFVTKQSDMWTYTPTMYWPADDKPVNFFSISPSIPGGTIGNPDKPDIPGFVNSNGSVDLLYAVNMGQKGSVNAQVKVNFRHAMSQVRFMLRRKADTANTPVRVDVDGVEIVNIYSKGDFEIPRVTTSVTTTDRGDWENLSAMTNAVIYNGEPVTLTDTPKEYNSTGYIFALPQDLAESSVSGNTYSGAYVRVRCAVYDEASGVKIWPSASTPGYVDGMAYVYFPLNGETTRYNEWEPGKAYNYTLSVGVPAGSTAIDFSVTVDEYQDFVL